MSKKAHPGRRKHVPVRTCVACRQAQPKRDLLRVVRTPEGHVMVDPTGKHAGRGAYLCRRKSCWEQAFRRKNLEHALKTTFNPEERQFLESYAFNIPDGPAESSENGEAPDSVSE